MATMGDDVDSTAAGSDEGGGAATGAQSAMLRGRYRLVGRIGRGGMATVWRAHDEALDRDVAIKVFEPGELGSDDIRKQEAEAKMVAHLSHHGIVTLLDAGVDLSDRMRPRIYLVMELVEGSDLKETIADGPMSVKDIAYIGHDLAEALEYVHHQGVVHRDIKPANVLTVNYGGWNSRPRGKLTDFGIAMPLDALANAEDNGTTTGTAAYLSPEQANLLPAIPASDIYSLGLVLLECFTRTVAFPGDAVASAVARLLHDPSIPEELDPDWRSLLLAMTARDPSERPTASEAMVALRDLVIAAIGGRHRSPTETPAAAEAKRMSAVRDLDILDTPREERFDRITSLTARVLGAPIALISIVDEERIWFKSTHGLALEQITRDPGLCASAILQPEPWIIEDARRDARASSNPLVTGGFGMQFYAGVPVTSKNGQRVGTLCILDFEPRQVTADEVATLVDLAAMASSELTVRERQRAPVELHAVPPSDSLSA
jgi:serine/threonine protein kinase